MQHPETEQILDKFGVTYQYESLVPLSEIHITDANRQNIRPGGLDTDRIEQYTQAMENGADFPAIVLYRTARKGYAFLGGMHRIEAAKRAKREGLDAYIADVDEKRDERTIEVLQRTLNMQHGGGYGRDERILHGVRLMALGYTSKDASKMVLVPETTLRLRQEIAGARIRTTGLKLKLPSSDNILNELNRIRNDELFGRMVELTNKARLNIEQAKDFSKQVREQTTEKGMKEVIARWETDLASTVKATQGGKYRVPASDAQKAINALIAISHLSPKVLKKATNYERERLVTQIKATVQALQRTLALIVTEMQRGGEAKKRA